MIRDYIQAGVLVRRQVRALLDMVDADWTEHKGLLVSTFVVRASPDAWRQIRAACREAS